jgi:hypothetical protein
MRNRVGFSSRSDESRTPEPAPKPKLSPERLNQVRQAAEAQIDAFLKMVGITNPAQFTDSGGWRYMSRGSVQGRAAILESGGELYLRVEAHVMPMPSDRDLILPLMRELLELNMQISGSARLGIDGDAVFVSNTHPVMELQESDDFAQMIHAAMAMADDLDDELLKKYGGTTQPRVGVTTADRWVGGGASMRTSRKPYGEDDMLRKQGHPKGR